MSSTERSRRFRQRNPGYDMLRMRRERAAIDASLLAAQQHAAVKVQLALPAPAVTVPDLLAQIHAARAARDLAHPPLVQSESPAQAAAPVSDF